MTEPGRSREQLHHELDAASTTFRELLEHASDEQLRALTRGTRWTNEELLFHMLFGYLVVRALLPIVRAFGRLPLAASRGFSALLDAATGPFNLINYWGSRLGSKIINRNRMAGAFDRVIAALHRRLDAESDSNLACTMAFPTRWDPFFRPVMTLTDVYHYPGDHFDFHRQQLTLDIANT